LSDAAETLLNGALEALQRGDVATCEASSSKALELLSKGDARIPEALSLRGTARLGTSSEAALADLEDAVKLDPKEPQFLLALGRGLMSLGRFADAETPLAKAFQISKGNPAAAMAYGRCLIALNKSFQAVQMLGPLLEAGRATPNIAKLFAEARFQSGDIFGAKDVFAQIYGAEGPQSSAEHLQMARIEMALRNYDDANAHIDQILTKEPRSVDARISALRLADWQDRPDAIAEHIEVLSQYGDERYDALSLVVEHAENLDDGLIAKAGRLLDEPAGHADDQASLGLALALRFDREGRFDDAFRLASKVNGWLSQARGHDHSPEARAAVLETARKKLSTALDIFKSTSDLIPDRSGPSFIYLLGAPRTGSSLIQSVLASPDGVTSVGERTSLYPYLAEITQTGMTPQGFVSFVGQLHQADKAGLNRIGVETSRLVDKTPHHLFIAGLLERVHPGATFVQVFRDAGDVALSMFLRPFSHAFGEATDLNALADLLAFRLEVREAWRAAGLKIDAFSYDRFVRQPAEEGKALFKRIGLEWDESYLDPAQRPEAVPTFSSRQVRKPISAPKIPHWSHYRSFAPEAFDRLAEITSAQNQITGQNTLS
tara:strand:+ start:52210 stop:54018 length:1809 start_codon:yes stop_codon:yes gene_type:complete